MKMVQRIFKKVLSVFINFRQPIRGTTQIWLVTHDQYGISTLVPLTSFRGETKGAVAK